MAEQNNVTCSICGKGYHLCLACKSNRLTPWKVYTDTSEHYQIFQILRGVNTGVYTNEEAKEKFKNVDLSDLDDLLDSVKKQIKEILEFEPDKVSENVELEVKKPVSRKRKTKVVETE